jgi:hypothetical protein
MIRRGKAADREEALTAARAEVARLSEELQRLRMERLRGNAVASAVERADRIEDSLAAAGEREDAEWHERVDAIALREMLLDLCESVERAMAASRAQLRSGLRANELDRRRGDRRRSERAVPSAPALGVDAVETLAEAAASRAGGGGNNGRRSAGRNGRSGNGRHAAAWVTVAGGNGGRSAGASTTSRQAGPAEGGSEA